MAATLETAEQVRAVTEQKYKYGFFTDIESETAPGLSEDIVRLISAKKNEPEWLLEWRLKAYRHWLTMEEPTWPNVHYPAIDYQDIIYYSAPKAKTTPKSLDEVDPELLSDFREARHPAGGAEDPGRRRRRCRVRQRVGGDHVQGEARRDGHHLLLVLRSGAEPSGPGAEVSRARSCRTRTTSSRR